MSFQLVRTSFDDVNRVLDVLLADSSKWPSCLVRVQTGVPTSFPFRPNQFELAALARRTLIALLNEWRSEGADSDEAELKPVPSKVADDEIERLIRTALSSL